jgi:hypothetical protein
MPKRTRSTGLTLALLLGAWLVSSQLAAAQCELCGTSSMSAAQVTATLRRAEQQLLRGDPAKALHLTRPLGAAFLSEGAASWSDFSELWQRTVVLESSAAVRLSGKVPDATPGADAHAQLVLAEQRLREALQQTAAPPVAWVTRHAEALVALARYEDAYRVLAPLQATGKLTEPEAAAALAQAAKELGHTAESAAATKRCIALAKSQAPKRCLTQHAPASR